VTSSGTPLLDALGGMIRDGGPIGIDRYMELCLGHPLHGYYLSRQPFGRDGDFTTAPEISQMFGELVGLALAGWWLDHGRPPAVDLVEVGPGRGTLMADMLRAFRAVPGLGEALDVTLVETSPRLAALQRERLAGLHPRLAWATSLAEVPAGRPLLLVANEFLDALPVRQFLRVGDRWHERLVGLDSAGGLAFGLAATPADLPGGKAPPGAVFEICQPALAFGRSLGERLARVAGLALLIDYGHTGGHGDTLQAMRGHAFVDPLDRPGEADLTAHVDFAAFAAACRAGGGATHGPVPQGAFLRALGIETRAAALAARAKPLQQADIRSAEARLTGPGPEGMGDLFKVIAITAPGDAVPAGFPPG
jgi:SAM-dependent MidA family methyltransferase